MDDATKRAPVWRRKPGASRVESDPLPDLHMRAPDPAVCPFLRAEASDGSLVLPIGAPDDTNRCAAFGGPVPQSHTQQEIVCLTDAHVGCPRYLRGSRAAPDQDPALERRGMTTAILASILLLIATMTAAIAFVIARGGLALPTPGLPTAAAALPSPTIVALPTPSASPTTPSPEPSLTPTPSPGPGPTPTPSSGPSLSTTPNPTSDRYALLEPCPDAPDCWIYVVRAGDNLTSIANYFGVPLASVYDLNPDLRTQSLQPGRELILPPPTR